MGPKDPSSSALSREEEEAIIVAFRKHTLLPLDDCLYALQATIQHLTRFPPPLPAAPRHLPLAGDGGREGIEEKVQANPIGLFHSDIAEVRTEEGKLYLFVATDRTPKIAFAKLVDKANTAAATEFLDALVQAIPYKINVVLTDKVFSLLTCRKNRSGPTAMLRGHPFERTASNIGSPSLTIPGPMDRSNE